MNKVKKPFSSHNIAAYNVMTATTTIVPGTMSVQQCYNENNEYSTEYQLLDITVVTTNLLQYYYIVL